MAETAIAPFERMKAELAEVVTIDQAKGIRDRAEALRAYYQTARHGLDVQNGAAEVKLWAERRGGELLAGMDRHKGTAGQGRPKKGSHNATPKTMLSDLGLTKSQSSRWRRRTGRLHRVNEPPSTPLE